MAKAKKRTIPVVPPEDREQLNEGVPKKKRKSVVVSFSISEEIYNKFEQFFEENCIDKSKLIEKLILKHIEK